MRVLSRTGVELLHGRVTELERQVAELQEQLLAVRSALESIHQAVTQRGADDQA